jgi:hypothetical protein
MMAAAIADLDANREITLAKGLNSLVCRQKSELLGQQLFSERTNIFWNPKP